MFFKRRKSKAERLYEKYSRIMYIEADKILNDKALAEDVVAEAFLKIIKNPDKIDEDNPSKTIGFLVTICRHEAYRIINKKRMEFLGGELETQAAEDDNPVDLIIAAEDIMCLTQIIKGLKQQHYEVLYFKYIAEMKNSEIAEFLEISETALRMRISRAKKALREELEGQRKYE